MLRKTKIVCTLGPATDQGDVLKKLMQSGMNVARFNFSHQTREEHQKRFEQVCRVRDELGLPIATLLDTKGPEIRLHTFADQTVTLKKGQTFTLYMQERTGDETGVSITYPGLWQDVKTGSHILIDDGLIDLKVRGCDEEKIICEVENGGTVSDHKGINVPDVSLSMPFVSEQDRKDIVFGVQMGFDFIAASFTRSAEDIQEIRSILNERHCHSIRIIAKIENREGVQNIDEILRIADGIMVARGDMGVEIPYEELPHIQKMLIKKAYQSGKQVITATQMLDSMMVNPRPTRAEASDVANAIYDGTSALMLSGETAAGAWPVEACQAMVKIAQQTEENIHYKKRFAMRELYETPDEEGNITQAIAKATVTTAHNLAANAIITVSMSGNTARVVSRYRPMVPIVGGSTDPQICRQMNLSWGVYPILLQPQQDANALFDHAIGVASNKGYLQDGDVVVITAGVPLGVSGTTNMIKVQLVGHVLLSGQGITDQSVCANLCVAKSEEEALMNYQKGDILVIQKTTNNLLNIMRSCSGIITETGGYNSHAAIVGLTLKKPVIIGATGATSILKSGVTVLMDGQSGRVSSAS